MLFVYVFVMGTRRKTDEQIAESTRLRHERYRAKNAESIKLRIAQWKQKNKHALSEKSKERYKTDISHRLRVTCRNRVQGAIKAKKSIKTMDLVGCTGEQLKQHLETQFKDGMNWENQGSFWHIDHIMPCDSFDLTKKSHQKRCFHYTNLQPLEAVENLRKNNKQPLKHQFRLL
jgi:hypothetical protein